MDPLSPGAQAHSAEQAGAHPGDTVGIAKALLVTVQARLFVALEDALLLPRAHPGGRRGVPVGAVGGLPEDQAHDVMGAAGDEVALPLRVDHVVGRRQDLSAGVLGAVAQPAKG